METIYTELSRGITPAYAGKSQNVSDFRILIRDHPRLCGEKSAVGMYRREMWRITPAYAGKSHRIGQERPCF